MVSKSNLLVALCLAIYTVRAPADLAAPGAPVQNVIQSLTINYQISLDNLFHSENIQPLEETASAPGNFQQEQLPIQLVGTLIFGQQKLAWIRVTSQPDYELLQGQLIPGSTMKINRISPDSVEIIDAGGCVSGKTCKQRLTLDFSQ